MINFKQNAAIHGLLTSLGEMAYKVDYVLEVSKGRTSHISELSALEVTSLLAILNDVKRGQRAALNPNTVQAAAVTNADIDKANANQLRRRILKCCHQLGWYKQADGTLVLNNGKPVLDYKRIDAYCIKYSPAKKALNEHTTDELKGKSGLVFQFETMERNYIHNQKS